MYNFLLMYRFYWKIVDNGDGRAMAFIGYNFPGTRATANLQTPISLACSSPIEDIFKNADNTNYIKFDAYGSGNNKFYGYIFACELKNVLIPEMILVRDNYIGTSRKEWLPLKTVY